VDHAVKRKKHAINCNERLRAGSRSSDVEIHFFGYQSYIKSNALISDRMLPYTQIGKRGRESSGAQSIICYKCIYRLSTHLTNRFNENPLESSKYSFFDLALANHASKLAERRHSQ
jgi:hypothetical protein